MSETDPVVAAIIAAYPAASVGSTGGGCEALFLPLGDGHSLIITDGDALTELSHPQAAIYVARQDDSDPGADTDEILLMSPKPWTVDEALAFLAPIVAGAVPPAESISTAHRMSGDDLPGVFRRNHCAL